VTVLTSGHDVADARLHREVAALRRAGLRVEVLGLAEPAGLVEPIDEIAVTGCDYEVVRDVPGRPLMVKLLGMPGEKASVRLEPGGRRFSSATLDGRPAPELVKGEAIEVSFPGAPLRSRWHRN
jgi:hypothetical protein